jgi:hypothetical protein
MDSDLQALLGVIQNYLYELRKQGLVDYSATVKADVEARARAVHEQLEALERIKAEQAAKVKDDAQE